MTTDIEPPIGPFGASLAHVVVGRDRIALWHVRDLESHVDREALLRGDDPAEPPYWAHLWSGAKLLAAAVPRRSGRVLELGCGLGLPALTAAHRGASVVAVDRDPTALAFVRASAVAGGCRNVGVVLADFREIAFAVPFDVVLLAEVLYDRRAFDDLVRTLDRVLAPSGVVLMADGRRIETSAFYAALARGGFRWNASDFVVMEEGFPVRVRLATITRRVR